MKRKKKQFKCASKYVWFCKRKIKYWKWKKYSELLLNYTNVPNLKIEGICTGKKIATKKARHICNKTFTTNKLTEEMQMPNYVNHTKITNHLFIKKESLWKKKKYLLLAIYNGVTTLVNEK